MLLCIVELWPSKGKTTRSLFYCENAQTCINSARPAHAQSIRSSSERGSGLAPLARLGCRPSSSASRAQPSNACPPPPGLEVGPLAAILSWPSILIGWPSGFLAGPKPAAGSSPVTLASFQSFPFYCLEWMPPPGGGSLAGVLPGPSTGTRPATLERAFLASTSSLLRLPFFFPNAAQKQAQGGGHPLRRRKMVGAVASPLAGVRLRPRASAPPSSGRAAVLESARRRCSGVHGRGPIFSARRRWSAGGPVPRGVLSRTATGGGEVSPR